MTIQKSFTTIALSMGIILGLAFSAFAEERVLGSWIANGKLFSVKEDKNFFHGNAKGVVHHTGGGGQLDTARLDCVFTMRVDKKMNSEKGDGFCAFTTNDNDKVYGEFTCAGPIKECKGTFTHLDGTGKYKGISGETKLQWKAHIFTAKETAKTSKDFIEVSDSSEIRVSGYFILPNLKYSLPN